MSFEPNEQYKMCRRCKTKLKEPAENKYSAFCSKGCYRYFYNKRCLVCEEPTEKPLCGKRACRVEWSAVKRHGVAGKFAGKIVVKSSETGESSLALKTAPAARVKIGVQDGVEVTPTPRLIAGLLTPKELRLATVGYAPRKRTEVKLVIGPLDPPINVIGGYQFPGTERVIPGESNV